MKREFPLTLMNLFDASWIATLEPGQVGFIALSEPDGHVRMYVDRGGKPEPIGALPSDSSSAHLGSIRNPFEPFPAENAARLRIANSGGKPIPATLTKVFSHQKPGYSRPWLIVYAEADL